MDKNLIILILVVAVMLASLIAVIVWLAWPTIREIRLTNKRHKRYEARLIVKKSTVPFMGTLPRTEETDYRPSFGNW